MGKCNALERFYDLRPTSIRYGLAVGRPAGCTVTSAGRRQWELYSVDLSLVQVSHRASAPRNPVGRQAVIALALDVARGRPAARAIGPSNGINVLRWLFRMILLLPVWPQPKCKTRNRSTAAKLRCWDGSGARSAKREQECLFTSNTLGPIRAPAS